MRTYKTLEGRELAFNEHVVAEMVPAPIAERSGRLVQVRKRCGQFGSDIFCLRLADGRLHTFENCLLRSASDETFVNNFYRANGREAPALIDVPIHPGDSEEAIYTIQERWPETGFIIDHPEQPETPGAFTLAITHPITTPT